MNGVRQNREKPLVAVPEDGAYVLELGSRRWTVRGLSAFGLDRMRVTLRVDEGRHFHVDVFDLYSDRSRQQFIERAGQVLGSDPAAISREIGTVITAMERERLALRSRGVGLAPQKPSMTDAERDEALAMLRSPKLIDITRSDFAALGCVGEAESLFVAYLAALSRRLREPLSVLFCARSGAGKSTLQDLICELTPPEDLIKYTMPQSIVLRQEIQQVTGLSYWHLRVYLQQLVECEYVRVARGHQGKRIGYELLSEGEGEDPAAGIGPQR